MANKPHRPKKIFVAGIVTSREFQKCKFLAQRLHKYAPKEFGEPEIRHMLDVDWTEYLTKTRRTYGNGMWSLKKSAVAFVNGELLGSDEELLQYITRRYFLVGDRNFERLGKTNLMDIFVKNIISGRQYAYLTIAIDGRQIGSMLFLLYSDLVPITCGRFMRKLQRSSNGFKNTPVHRIVSQSWIQCGGWNIRPHRMPCENYIVPHNRRGVLSMCHNGKHTDNSRQFSISLAPTPWMDYLYVAFGQLVHGENILQEIEKVPTYYESPLKQIEIVNCGKFYLSTYKELSKKDFAQLEEYLSVVDPITKYHFNVKDIRDRDSVMLLKRYKRGLYCAETDTKSHLPFIHLPDYLLSDGESDAEMYYPYPTKSVHIREEKEILELPLEVNFIDYSYMDVAYEGLDYDVPMPRFAHSPSTDNSEKFRFVKNLSRSKQSDLDKLLKQIELQYDYDYQYVGLNDG